MIDTDQLTAAAVVRLQRWSRSIVRRDTSRRHGAALTAAAVQLQRWAGSVAGRFSRARRSAVRATVASGLRLWACRVVSMGRNTRHGCPRRAPRSPGVPPSLIEQVQEAVAVGNAFTPARTASGQLRRPVSKAQDPRTVDLKESVFMLMAASNAPSTLETYSHGMKKFFMFRQCFGKPDWFPRNSTQGEIEDELMNFYAYYTVTCNYSYNTVHGWL